ncbi:hypothetical protein HK102_014017 [Quaeritorhiza haematococci]|nr:hypothetical protein HK102_014017 [Quaeritorhiza haematococci]
MFPSRKLLLALAAATIAYISHAPSLIDALPFKPTDIFRRADPFTSGDFDGTGDGEGLQRIVAVGDLHGDFQSAVDVLRNAGIIDREENWVGGKTIFVQNGDIVDRGPDTILLYRLMMKLETQASDAGGKVVALLGNHEVMNMMDDVRYVHPDDVTSFESMEARKHEFSKDGVLGQWLRTKGIAANVLGTVFVHGGIHPTFAARTLRKLNEEVQSALDGHLTLYEMYNTDTITGDDCPIWYRGYASLAEEEACPLLEQALQDLQAERMVIGHTPSETGHIRARCYAPKRYISTGRTESVPQLYVIDTGISKAYGSLGKSALEIIVRKREDGYETVSVKGLYVGWKKEVFEGALLAYLSLPLSPITALPTTVTRSPSTSQRLIPKDQTRIVAVGDLHGDLQSTLQVLKIAGVIDEQRNWIGGRTVLVQTGDVVDRGPDTIAIFGLLRELEGQAEAVGGKVVVLLGNHEALNLMEDWRYVHEQDIDSYGSEFSRAYEWSTEGELGKWLRTKDVATVINGTLFVHAGITPEYAKLKTLKELNTDAREALQLSVAEMWQDPMLTDEQGPLWYRGYAEDHDVDTCPDVNKVLMAFRAERMVIGHTPQDTGRILSRCVDYNPISALSFLESPRLYIIDVGISSAYQSRGKAVLEIMVRKDEETGLDETVSVKGLYAGYQIVFEEKSAKDSVGGFPEYR